MFSVNALAKTSGYVTRNFGELSISCRITCTTGSGTADTKGAPYGYKNVANIIVKDKNGVALGSNSTTTAYNFVATATKSISGNKIKSALSGHFVLDSNYNPAQPLYMQINLTQEP
ncbi:MAG: hypothetical protein NC225_03850 [Clostridium sp.]|nr:hypothetical protein [Clostridium sp.]MCM1398600.1 hypothetical protein [Clostridium sp.]MCM1459888.1 hypothetical protein [Bacteroides sp.]